MAGKRDQKEKKKTKKKRNQKPVVVAQRPKQVHPSSTSAPTETFSGFQRLDDETIKYFLEVKSHFDSLDDPKEQTLLVGNVLEELSGKEVNVCTDATCSRILEALIPSIGEEQILPLLTAFAQGEEFCMLASRPFGSRVAEQLLARLGELLDSAHDQESADRLYEVLRKLTEVTVAHMWEFATDRNASHVARRLLCVVAGRDVTPAQTAAAQPVDGAAFIRAAKQGKGMPGGLAAKIGAENSGERLRMPARHPELLTQIAGDLLLEKWSGGRLEELLFHAYACPWLQTLLSAAEAHEEVLEELVPRLLGAKASQEGDAGNREEEWTPLEGVPAEHVQGLAQDPTSSHFLEVVMRVAPERLLADVYQRFLRGVLARLAMHPSANFVVQAYLAALHGAQQVKAALRELRDTIPEMLRGRRSGVAAALLAAASRTGNAAVQADAARALASALAALQSAASPGDGQGLAASLLTHDSPAIKLGDPAGRARLSTLGCAMLATVLRLPKEASTDFAEGVADLSPAQLLHVGGDGGGSRALEAFLDGDASAKLKKRVIRKLTGSYGKLAGSPGGSHVVQTCFRVGGVKDKEVIAGELAAAEEHISKSKFGQILLRRCGVEDFKRSTDSWRTRAESAAVLRSEFAEMLGEGDGAAGAAGTDQQGSEDEGTSEHGRDALAAAAAEHAASEAAAVKRKKKKKGNAGLQNEAAAAADQPAGITSGHPGEGAKKKKRKHPSADDDSAEQASPAGVIAVGWKDSNGQKKKKKVKQQDAQGPGQAQKSGGLSGPPDAGGGLSRSTALEALLTGTEAQGLGKRHNEKSPQGKSKKAKKIKL